MTVGRLAATAAATTTKTTSSSNLRERPTRSSFSSSATRHSFTSPSADRRLSYASAEVGPMSSSTPSFAGGGGGGGGSSSIANNNNNNTTSRTRATSPMPQPQQASTSTNQQQHHHHHPGTPNHTPAQQRGSICSRVSSLTRDSSLRSLDPLKIELSDLTHLFGRTREQEMLQSAFVRVLRHDSHKKEIVSIHGKAGTGKTALVLDFKDAVTSTSSGYFCTGKFMQYEAVPTPYKAIVQSLNDLCQSIASGSKRELCRNRLYAGLELSVLQNLAKLLPKLKTLLSASRLYASDDDDFDQDDDDDLKQSRHSKATTTTKSALDGVWKDNIHQLQLAIQSFLQALCTPSHPIVMFLDDLQWADSASLNFITTLINNLESNNFMFIASYRDDVQPQMPFVCDITKQNVTDIELSNLNLDSVDEILSDLTGSAGVTELAKIVLEKTHGNPFSIFQFLELLQRKDLLVFSFQTHRWIWDLELVRSKTEVTHNVGHALLGNVDRLSREGKKIMSLAAMIGFSFDPNILEQIAIHLGLLDHEYREHMSNAMKGVIQDAVSGGLIHPDQMREVMATQLDLVDDGSGASIHRSFYEETIQSVLQEAEVEGLIGKAVGRIRYKFSHDLVHQSLYRITPSGEEREFLHLRIGKVMRAFFSAREDDEMLFNAVDHLNRGSAHLDGESDRMDLVELNRKASQKAQAKSALFSAAEYSKKAIELLQQDHDWNSHYDLMLDVYSEAAELNFACGRFDLSWSRCAEVEANTKDLEDGLRAAYIRIEVLYAQREVQDAITHCVSTLNQLGESISNKPSKGQCTVEHRRTRQMLKGLGDDALLSLPTMSCPAQLQCMRFYTLLAKMTFHSSDGLLVAMVFLRMVRKTVKEGFCAYTPFAIAGYGMLITFIGSAKEAFNYGSLAMTLCGRLAGGVAVPGTYMVVYSYLDHLRNPLLNGVEPLLRGYQIGIGNGEVHFAATCMAASAAIGFHCALPLKVYSADLEHICDRLKILNQHSFSGLVVPYWHAALNLAGEATENQSMPFGTKFNNNNNNDNGGTGAAAGVDNMNDMEKQPLDETSESLRWHTYYMVSYIVSYIMNDIELADETRKEMKKITTINGLRGMHFTIYLEVFFSGLLDMSLYRKTRKWKCLRQAKRSIRTMEKYVKEGIVNCHGLLLLLQAELESFNGGGGGGGGGGSSSNSGSNGGHDDLIKKIYDDAIKVFASGGFIHFEALSNERAAEYYNMKWNHNGTAAAATTTTPINSRKQSLYENYIKNAYKLYTEWGAIHKVQQLSEEHTKFFGYNNNININNSYNSNRHPNPLDSGVDGQQRFLTPPMITVPGGGGRELGGGGGGGEESRRFIPLQGHIEEEYLSSDLHLS